MGHSSFVFAALLIVAIMLPSTGPTMGETHAATKNVLWDLTHGVYNDYDPALAYSQLENLLATEGYTIQTTTAGVNNIVLSNYNVIVVESGAANQTYYSSAEVETIRTFVQDGGGLLVMSDNPDAPMSTNVAPVAQAFGTDVAVSMISPDDLYVTDFNRLYPIFSGVNRFYMRVAGEVVGKSPTEEIAWTDATHKTAVVTATSCPQKVVIFGDINWISNDYINQADNRVLAANTFDWLSTPCTSVTTTTTTSSTTPATSDVTILSSNGHGSMIVDGAPPIPLDESGYIPDWSVNSTHTIRALSNANCGIDIGLFHGCVYQFQEWVVNGTNPVSGVTGDSYSFVVTGKPTTITAIYQPDYTNLEIVAAMATLSVFLLYWRPRLGRTRKRAYPTKRAQEQRQPKMCMDCGAINPWDNAFCGKCGSNLDATRVYK
jgi:hypothetical protein